MPNLARPILASRAQDLGNNNPENRPFLEFDGNTAHSSG